MENSSADAVASIEISGLFGRFNHCVPLGGEEDLHIITAPNGYGKTVILRFLDAFFNRKFSYFRRVKFHEATITFRSGRWVKIHREEVGINSQESLLETRDTTIKSLKFSSFGYGDDQTVYDLTPQISSSRFRPYERYLPVDRVGVDRWLEESTQKTMTTAEVFWKYSDLLPSAFNELTDNIKLPEWLNKATKSVRVQLIETQRLLAIDQVESAAVSPRERKLKRLSVVETDAQDLAEKISRAVQRYADESQKLDQTFPKRIIEERATVVSGENEIRARLQEISKKREALVAAGIISESAYERIEPSDALDDESIRRILKIYAEDTERKLSVFDFIYSRINLFREIIDEHFLFKTVSTDLEKGIVISDDSDHSEIPLAALSSGEQHELVLIYGLLFKVDAGALILIDEPELSLHVVWQKSFISDILKIKKLNNISVVIATHSPQIINDKWDLVHELARQVE